MRTPERCPWCGAEPTDGEPSPYWGDQDYRCGAEMVGSEWVCTCPNRDTPDAVAYRTAMAWRKRLSQHTGVPLRLVPEPTWTSGIVAGWQALGINVPVHRSYSGWRLSIGARGGYMAGSRSEVRTEARRRLLAKGDA